MKSEQYYEVAKVTQSYAISCNAIMAQRTEEIPAYLLGNMEASYIGVIKVVRDHLQTPEYAEQYIQSIRANFVMLCGVGLTEEEYLQVPSVKDFLWKFDSNLCSLCGGLPRQYDSSLCGNCGYLHGVRPAPPVGL